MREFSSVELYEIDGNGRGFRGYDVDTEIDPGSRARRTTLDCSQLEALSGGIDWERVYRSGGFVTMRLIRGNGSFIEVHGHVDQLDGLLVTIIGDVGEP